MSITSHLNIPLDLLSGVDLGTKCSVLLSRQPSVATNCRN